MREAEPGGAGWRPVQPGGPGACCGHGSQGGRLFHAAPLRSGGRLRRRCRLTPPGAERLPAEVGGRRATTAVAAQRLGLAGGAA